jgi:hypothetical protein
VEISILHGDILRVPADLIILKYADNFHGADATISKALGFGSHIKPGEWVFTPGKPGVPLHLDKKGVAAPLVLFIGVGPLGNFRYQAIQEFSYQAIMLAAMHTDKLRHVALTIHGPGYGLDPEQSFLSLIAGIITAWKEGFALDQVTIVDRSKSRCEVLYRTLDSQTAYFGLRKASKPDTFVISGEVSKAPSNISRFGSRADDKPHLFVAMPFSHDFIDEFEIGFHEAAKANAFTCERLDLHAFTGDIVSEMERRIIASSGVIALLNDHNPNVFLEIGFSLAYCMPVILVAKNDVTVPFDIRSHRYITYRNITELRERLTAEIKALKDAGVLKSLK